MIGTSAFDTVKRAIRRKKAVELVRKHPGKNAQELVALGMTYETHGSLGDAERHGVIEWRDKGWYAKGGSK